MNKETAAYSTEFDEEGIIDPEIILADERYEIIGGILAQVYEPGERKWILSDMLDKVFLHKYLGLPIFFAIMWAMFYFTFEVSLVFMAIIESFFEYLGTYTSAIPVPWLASLMTDGLLAGVGFILTFIPPIFLLYLAISMLEDTGYLARAAFVMDKWMMKMGLHGRSFIPLLLGFGCSVASVMAARTVEGRGNRLTTILVSPLMSCAARLPVYVLVAGVFFPQYAGTVIFLLYILGIVMAIGVAMILKRSVLKEKSSSLLIELPIYQRPTAHGSFRHMWDRGVLFLKRAGTFLLAGAFVIWIISSFGLAGYGVPIDESFIAILGRAFQPLFIHMGFTWELVACLVFGLLAKEAVVQSLSIMYAVQGYARVEAALLATINPLAAIGFLVFVLLYIPCIATLGAIRKETNSWKWTAFAFVYQMLLAYLVASIIVLVGGFFFV